ncbi:MAG: NAD/NADP octopine/nopaline dehydrogenase family protein [Lachnospiraceae bacterium]|nr:NAD/NADP octopine/nopaline dehydrogenase family protein [Lachnospiraceae bacterium]
MEKIKFSIIGAGAGGTLMAVQLKNKGYYVNLMDKRADVIDKMKELGVLKASGKTEATEKPNLLTCNIKECIEGTEVIMVCTTTDAHGEIAREAAPFIKRNQIVLLNPGHLGGTLEFINALKDCGCKEIPIVGEASDLMYACRTVEIGHTLQTGEKSKISVASIPAKNSEIICNKLKEIFPCFVTAENVLVTGLSGGSLLHSIPCVMNINKVELGQNFDYYMEGLTPGVCNIIEAADKERCSVCEALGMESPTLLSHLKNVYGLEPDGFYDAIQSCKPYAGIKSPTNTSHRFFQEDTLSNLVPTASLGKLLGVATPTLDAIILLESQITGKDFNKEGRTVEKLGLAGKTVKEIYEVIS